jgi:cell shape-determining protein MreC
MRVFLTRRNITIIIAALLIAAVAIVAVNTSGTPGVVTTVAETLMRPLKNAVSTLARNFASIYGAMHKYDTLVAENAALQEQIASFKQDYRESTELAEENARLRELLNLS